jgi:hypothetical protein
MMLYKASQKVLVPQVYVKVQPGTSNTNRTLAKADVAGLQKSAQEQQAGNMLVLQAATETTKTAGVWQKQAGNGSTEQTLTQTLLKGQITFDPSLNISVQIPDGSIDTSKPVQFKGDLQSFLDSPEGQKMAGATGGVQGAEGSLFKGTFMGSTYTAGSWQDKLIESFAGTHDFLGGKLSGLYDDQGNATRGRSAIVSGAQEAWSMSGAIAVSTPFAAAQGLPPEVWKAISILIGAAR